MKKEELIKHLGERVTIQFYDGTEKSGLLGYTENFSEEFGWRKPGYFTIENIDFKVSHIKNLSMEPLKEKNHANYKDLLEELDR